MLNAGFTQKKKIRAQIGPIVSSDRDTRRLRFIQGDLKPRRETAEVVCVVGRHPLKAGKYF